MECYQASRYVGEKPRCIDCNKQLTKLGATRCRACEAKHRWEQNRGEMLEPLRRKETRKKMSEAAKKSWNNPEIHKKFVAGAIKYQSSPETKKKTSKRMKALWSTEEYRKKMEDLSEQKYKKISKSHKDLWKDDAYKQKMINLFNTKEAIKNRSNAQKKRYSDPKVRKEQSKKMKIIMNKPEIRKKYEWVYSDEEVKQKIRAARMKQQLPTEYTFIEIKMFDALKSAGICFTPQKPLENRFIVDVFIEPNYIVECDGDYWHNYPEGTDRDRKRDEFLKNKGYIISRFWERDINSNIHNCVSKIKKMLSR